MFNDLYTQDQYLTEKSKNSEEYLKGVMDKAISELAFDKDYIRKAYNYYNGTRDKDQFRYLEENFGIGTPTMVEFTPLVKRHIDALVGELIQTKLKPKVTCKDSKTLSLIERDKQKKILAEEIKALQSQLYDNLNYLLDPNNQLGKNPPLDRATQEELNKLRDDISNNFVSEFEIAAQHLIQFFIESRQIDLETVRKILFMDLLVAGQCYYRTYIKPGAKVASIDVLNPIDVYPETNENAWMINKSRRIVYIKYMTKEEIVNSFGADMSKEDFEKLSESNLDAYSRNVYYLRSQTGGLVSNAEATIPGTYPYFNDRDYSVNRYPVYFVEWLANNKVDKAYRLDRYKGVRIGGEIYVQMGKDDTVSRSMENPYECTLSINGIMVKNRSGKAYSLMLATAGLQDRYDILHFHRDTLIARSGTKGDWIDVSLIPSFLGDSPQERFLKFKAYKKNGDALIDTSQDGRGVALNTTFSGFDDTVNPQSIQAINLAIQQTEDICSAITGVFREKLGEIEQRDAVTNVAVGIHQSTVITKSFFYSIDLVTKEMLTDMLNLTKDKISESGEFTGSLILGNKYNKIFTIIPKNISFTDYDIHIGDSSEIIKEIETIKQLNAELIKGGSADLELIYETVDCESLSELKDTALKSIKKKKDENNATQQLQQQLQQYEQQIQQYDSELKKLQKQLTDQEQAKIQLKQQELNLKDKIENKKIDANSDAKDKEIELKKKQVDAEVLQLTDHNPYNNEIKNIS